MLCWIFLLAKQLWTDFRNGLISDTFITFNKLATQTLLHKICRKNFVTPIKMPIFTFVPHPVLLILKWVLQSEKGWEILGCTLCYVENGSITYFPSTKLQLDRHLGYCRQATTTNVITVYWKDHTESSYSFVCFFCL